MASPPTTIVSRPGPVLLSAALGAGAVLSVLGRGWSQAQMPGDWVLASLLAGLLTTVAMVRAPKPAAPGRWVGWVWMVAGIAGAGLIGRHLLEALGVSAAELAMDAPVVGPVLQADAFLALLLALAVVPALVGAGLRGGRAGGVIVAALVGLVLLAVPLGPELGDKWLPLPRDGRLGPAVALLPTVAALAWLPALVGPGTVALDPARRLSGRLLPQIVGLALVAGLPLVLLALHGADRLGRGGEVVMSLASRSSFGPWAHRVGAGFECLGMLGVTSVFLGLVARVVLRRTGRPAWAIVPVLVLGATAAVAVLSTAQLVVLAATAGWAATIAGSGDPAGSKPLPGGTR